MPTYCERYYFHQLYHAVICYWRGYVTSNMELKRQKLLYFKQREILHHIRDIQLDNRHKEIQRERREANRVQPMNIDRDGNQVQTDQTAAEAYNDTQSLLSYVSGDNSCSDNNKEISDEDDSEIEEIINDSNLDDSQGENRIVSPNNESHNSGSD